MPFTNVWETPARQSSFGNVWGPSGGTWDTSMGMQQANADSLIADLFTKLRSPEEYNKLPDGIRNSFGGYMGYVNAFASRQKASQMQQGAYESASKGQWEPQQYQTISQGTSGGSRRMPGKTSSAAGGQGIPSTRTHRDISGRVILEPTGGGMRRDIQGELIPESLDAMQAGEELKYAIPSVQEESAGDYLTKKANRVKLESEIAFPKRQEALIKTQQGQERLRLAQQAITQRYQISRERVGDARALMELKQELTRDRDVFKHDLAISDRGANQAFVKAMKEADYAQDDRQQAQHLENALTILNSRAAIAKTADEADRQEELKQKIAERVFKLQLLQYKLDLTPEIKSAANRQAVNEQSKISAESNVGQSQPPEGAKQAADGKWYIQQNGKWYLWQP